MTEDDDCCPPVDRSRHPHPLSLGCWPTCPVWGQRRNISLGPRMTNAPASACPTSPDSDACTDQTPCPSCPSAVGLLTADEVAAGVAGQESAWGDVPGRPASTPLRPTEGDA